MSSATSRLASLMQLAKCNKMPQTSSWMEHTWRDGTHWLHPAAYAGNVACGLSATSLGSKTQALHEVALGAPFWYVHMLRCGYHIYWFMVLLFFFEYACTAMAGCSWVSKFWLVTWELFMVGYALVQWYRSSPWLCVYLRARWLCHGDRRAFLGLWRSS